MTYSAESQTLQTPRKVHLEHFQSQDSTWNQFSKVGIQRLCGTSQIPQRKMVLERHGLNGALRCSAPCLSSNAGAIAFEAKERRKETSTDISSFTSATLRHWVSNPQPQIDSSGWHWNWFPVSKIPMGQLSRLGEVAQFRRQLWVHQAQLRLRWDVFPTSSMWNISSNIVSKSGNKSHEHHEMIFDHQKQLFQKGSKLAFCIAATFSRIRSCRFWNSWRASSWALMGGVCLAFSGLKGLGTYARSRTWALEQVPNGYVWKMLEPSTFTTKTKKPNQNNRNTSFSRLKCQNRSASRCFCGA